MEKRHSNNILLQIFTIIIFTASLISAQELHRTGLISEDLSKISWIKKFVSLQKTTSLPSSVDVSALMPPVGDQGLLGSCVAWSVGYYGKTYEVRREKGWDQTLNTHIFSPTFMYNQINNGVDSGAQISNAAKMLINNGCATLSDCPTSSNYYQLPTETAFNNALNYRSADAYSINTTSIGGINALREILAAGKVATIGINIYSNFDNISSYNYVYCANNRSGSNRGGHAVTLVGYNDSLVTVDGYGAFKFVNSWGTGWGISGYAWISYKALMDNYIGQGIAITVNNNVNYTPLLKAKLKITHGSRGYVNLVFGLGNAAAPTMSTDLSFHTSASVNRAFPSNNIVFDLTDFYDAITKGTANNIYLSYEDTKNDSYAATIDSLYIIDVLNNQKAYGLTTTTTINTAGSKVFNMSLTPATAITKVLLNSPSNSDANVAESPVLTWKANGSGVYRVKVSTDDVNFDSKIVYSNTVNDVTVQIPALLRNKVYYWKVASDNTENWSDTWSFKITMINSHDYSVTKQAYSWVDIASTGTAITGWCNVDTSGKIITSVTNSAVKDDGYATSKIPIGFSFDFYGKKYDSLYVGVNGLVSFSNQMLNAAMHRGFASNLLGCFDPGYFPPENMVFPASIAIAYNDFDLDNTDGYGGGKIVYKTIGTKFILSWINIGSFESSGDTTNSFQLILNSADNSIVANYKSFGKVNTINALKSCIQNSDTLAVLWVAAGSPAANLVSNASSIIYTKNTTSVGEDKNQIAKTFALSQNYPNPFNPSTIIEYTLNMASHVSIKVYDILGNEVVTLVNEEKPAGSYFANFKGAGLASGTYFYRLVTPAYSEVRKMTLLK